jgi:FAD/FMN-containing dehydrogenase
LRKGQHGCELFLAADPGPHHERRDEAMTPMSAPTAQGTATWTNWVGNQTFTCSRIERPASEDAVRALVASAGADDTGIRVAASGHSFTPVVQTDGVLLDLSALSGLVRVDTAERRVVARAGTPIKAFGDALWDAGLALSNQGDIDTQLIAGAVATGTHGSGLRQSSFSGSVRGVRLVDGRGQIVEIDERQPELLRAAQVSIGMLGVMTEIALEVSPAYRLQERIEYLHLDDVIDRWDDALERHRHFSFFWMPTDQSPELYLLSRPTDLDMTNRCYVKFYDELPAGPEDDQETTFGKRRDRSYRIYPDTFDPNFHEMEYMVPCAQGKDAFAAVRRLMREEFPQCIFPVEIRFIAADDGYLSSNRGRATTVISVSGQPGTDYVPWLRAVDRTLAAFDARPHWGKLHFMTEERLAGLFPEFEQFREIRRELDPQGLFLNDHLRPLFA